MLRGLTWALFALFVLSACANENTLSDYPQGGPVPNLVLLNADGIEGPAQEPASGISPFGAMVSRVGNHDVCTVTHLTYGRVATNAHCFKESHNPQDYTIFFYDQQGQKETSPIQRIVFMGNAKQDDLALLEIPSEIAGRWDTAGLNLLPTDQFEQQQQNVRFRVRLWSYDPLTFHSDLASRYGNFGVVFNPRECSASRKLPRVIGIDADKKQYEIRSSKNDSKLQIFLDGCDRPMVPGNSGSLITEYNHFDLKVGVYQSGLEPPAPDAAKKVPEFTSFRYTGNDGIDVELKKNQLMGGDVFGWGTVFESVRHQHPELFSQDPPPMQNVSWGLPNYNQ